MARRIRTLNNAQLSRAYSRLKVKLDSLEQRLDDSGTSNSSSNSTSDLVEMRSELSNVSSQVSNVSSRLSSVTSQVSNVSSQVSNVSSRISNVSSRVDTLESSRSRGRYDDFVRKSDGQTPSLGRLNVYPNGSSVGSRRLRDGNIFALIVRPGNSINVGSKSYTAKPANETDEPLVFAKDGNELRQVGSTAMFTVGSSGSIATTPPPASFPAPTSNASSNVSSNAYSNASSNVGSVSYLSINPPSTGAGQAAAETSETAAQSFGEATHQDEMEMLVDYEGSSIVWADSGFPSKVNAKLDSVFGSTPSQVVSQIGFKIPGSESTLCLGSGNWRPRVRTNGSVLHQSRPSSQGSGFDESSLVLIRGKDTPIADLNAGSYLREGVSYAVEFEHEFLRMDVTDPGASLTIWKAFGVRSQGSGGIAGDLIAAKVVHDSHSADGRYVVETYGGSQGQLTDRYCTPANRQFRVSQGDRVRTRIEFKFHRTAGFVTAWSQLNNGNQVLHFHHEGLVGTDLRFQGLKDADSIAIPFIGVQSTAVQDVAWDNYFIWRGAKKSPRQVLRQDF